MARLDEMTPTLVVSALAMALVLLATCPLPMKRRRSRAALLALLDKMIAAR